ncbi:hypothetical protein GCM10027285_02860 [Oleiagrimonas citrea]
MACSLQRRAAPRKAQTAPARIRPHLDRGLPASRPRTRRADVFHGYRGSTPEMPMTTATENTDLQRGIEPLRVILAIGALLLGLLVGLL